MDRIGSVAENRERRGNQTLARLIAEVKAKNINPTHFLLIYFGFNDVPLKIQNQIRRDFYFLINNKKYRLEMNSGEEGDEIFIRWKSPNSSSSALYYTFSRFDETYVRQLTRGIIQGAYAKTLNKFVLNETNVQLNYLTSKNMEFTINIATGHQEFIGNALPETPRVDFESSHFITDGNEEA